MSQRSLLYAAGACFLIAALGIWVLVANAQCQRCLVVPTPTTPLTSYGAYPVPYPTANLAASDWQIITNGLTYPWLFTVWPFNQDNGALRITLPPLDAGTLDYLYTVSPYSVVGYSRFGVSFGVLTTSGAPSISYPPNGCDKPAMIRILLYSLSYRGTEFERWWSTAAEQAMVPNADPAVVGTLLANLTNPSEWYSVLGKTGDVAPVEFSAALAGAQLGVTFGGGCFAGHGVGVVNGSADFLLHWYWVE